MEQADRYHAAAAAIGLGGRELRSNGNRNGNGKRGFEWDLNDWRWDGHLFIATPSPSASHPAAVNSSNTSSSNTCSDDGSNREAERKRRVQEQEDEAEDEAASLALKLGAAWEGKKTKLGATAAAAHSCSRAVCQVQDCAADLTKAKDYHRRHKVCEMHSKATRALVAGLMQRFCQQCSRFHLLQEFDEGKRSCRRRLAGHNKRRRKTQPDPAVQGNSVNEDQTTNSVLLISLLRILSNMHANNHTADQDLVAHLLTSLANPSGLPARKDITALLHHSHKLLTDIPGEGVHAADSSGGEMQMPGAADSSGGEMQMPGASSPKPEIEHMFPIKNSPPAYSDSNAGRIKLNNFDLNDVYVVSDDGMDDLDGNFPTASLDFPSWAHQVSHQSSPPQTSGNSDSASAQSPSSSSGEAQSRTDRIVFKLFGKEPGDFPIVLRGQILDWLAHSPTDIESYIRPGCIILTIYLRLAESMWEELCSGLSSCLSRLFDASDDAFWKTGWVYVRVQNHIAFRYNGQAVLNTSLPHTNCSRIVSIIPVAVSSAEQIQFQVRGSNLSRSTTRLLCALEGKYLNQETNEDSEEDSDSESDDVIDRVNLCCSIPNIVGRGFIEVEDHGLSSSFFPFIVAEKEVCSEIRSLETVLDLNDTDVYACDVSGKSEARRQAMDFLNEMGWLLHRSHLKSRMGDLVPDTVIFTFRRFKWLIDFSMDHDWCAVVKKLLDILLTGIVGTGEHTSPTVALAELGLLHRAVRRNCRSMVEQLLTYVPATVTNEFGSATDESRESFFFRPDIQGPAGLTPLHVAAGRDCSEDVLDALTDDPGKIGIEAWKRARDSTGATPEDYARLRGHYAYIHLVQRKINRRSASASSGHVVVQIDMPTTTSEPSAVGDTTKQDIVAAASFEIAGSRSMASKQSCKVCCDKKVMGYYGTSARSTSLVYRPAMLSMVAIAAVCVCVALLFKSMPNVVCLFRPFRWELLGYGSS